MKIVVRAATDKWIRDLETLVESGDGKVPRLQKLAAELSSDMQRTAVVADARLQRSLAEPASSCRLVYCFSRANLQVGKRRFNHHEWCYPPLLRVHGP
jgi:hypothetical protein